MPEPVSGSQRSAELRLHRNIVDRIHPDDIEGIKRLVMQNRDIVPDERTDAYALEHPITVFWNNVKLVIIDIYAKGVIFDSNKPLEPHYGRGFSESRFMVSQKGLISTLPFMPQPQGACLLSEAEREFVVTDAIFFSTYFRKKNILTKYPMGVGRFPDTDYSFGQDPNQSSKVSDTGFVLFGCNGFQNMRFTKQIFDETDYVVEAVEDAARMLRAMHEYGLSHPWLHLGNFFTTDGFSSVHDLGGSRYADIDDISEDAFLAQMIADLYYASRKLEEGHPLIAELFLSFYFHSSAFLKSDGFLGEVKKIFKKIQDVPISDIDHNLLQMLRDRIILKLFADRHRSIALQTNIMRKQINEKNILSAA